MELNKICPMVQGSTSEQDCSGATAYTWHVFTPMAITRIQALVSTVMSSSASVVLTFYRRPTYGSTSGQVTIGTLTIAATAAVGKVYWADVANVVINPGEGLICIATTVATTSGKVFPGFEACEDPEVPLNISNMVAG